MAGLFDGLLGSVKSSVSNSLTSIVGSAQKGIEAKAQILTARTGNDIAGAIADLGQRQAASAAAAPGDSKSSVLEAGSSSNWIWYAGAAVAAVGVLVLGLLFYREA